MYRALVQNRVWVLRSTASTADGHGNMQYFHVPFENIFPCPLGFNSSTFFPFTTIANGSIIDDVGLPDDHSELSAENPLDGTIFANGFESGSSSDWTPSIPNTTPASGS